MPREGNGADLHKTLAALRFPKFNKFTPDSLDWLFEDETSKDVWSWISKNLAEENYLNEEELDNFNKIPRGEVLADKVLEAALESAGDVDSDFSNEDLELKIAQLEAELGWNEDSLESLSFTKTRVIEKNDAESLFQGKLRSQLESEVADERRIQEKILQINSKYNGVLDSISRSLEALISEYSFSSETAQVHLYCMNMERIQEREQELDFQVSGLVSSLFGSKFNQLGVAEDLTGQNTRDVIEIGLVDVGSDTCLEFVRGRDREEFRHLQAEINRVRLSIFSAEMQRIRTDAKIGGLQTSLDFLARRLGMSPSNKSIEIGPTKPNLILQEDEEKIDNKLASLIAECMSCYCDRILTTDYKLKYRRSLFIINKMDSIREILLKRRSRQEVLDMLLVRETEQLLHLNATISNTENDLADLNKRSDLFVRAARNLGEGRETWAPNHDEPASSVLIPLEDTTFISLHNMLSASGKVEKLSTYPGVESALRKLTAQEDELKQNLTKSMAVRMKKLAELSTGVRNLASRGLRLDINSTKRLALLPREVSRGISSVESGMKDLEIKLKNLLTDWERAKVEVKTKPYCRLQRLLWIDFLLRPQIVPANVRAVENKSKR